MRGTARRDLGMPGAGPVKIITDMGILEANAASGEMELTALYPGVTVEQMRGAVGWPLQRARAARRRRRAHGARALAAARRARSAETLSEGRRLMAALATPGRAQSYWHREPEPALLDPLRAPAPARLRGARAPAPGARDARRAQRRRGDPPVAVRRRGRRLGGGGLRRGDARRRPPCSWCATSARTARRGRGSVYAMMMLESIVLAAVFAVTASLLTQRVLGVLHLSMAGGPAVAAIDAPTQLHGLARRRNLRGAALPGGARERAHRTRRASSSAPARA